MYIYCIICKLDFVGQIFTTVPFTAGGITNKLTPNLYVKSELETMVQNFHDLLFLIWNQK